MDSLLNSICAECKPSDIPGGRVQPLPCNIQNPCSGACGLQVTCSSGYRRVGQTNTMLCYTSGVVKPPISCKSKYSKKRVP